MVRNHLIVLVCALAVCTCAAPWGETAALAAPISHSLQPGRTGEDNRSATEGTDQTADRSAADPANVSSTLPTSLQDPGERRHAAQTFLEARLAVWQQLLNLKDWHISVVLTPRSDLKPNTLGGIRWDKTKKTAVMWVLDPSDYRLPFPEMLKDMEFTTVHELVHLELASLPRSEASRSTEEKAVNNIADALLGLSPPK